MILLNLPTEVLIIIAEALQNTWDINALAQTSRALYSYTSYVLYKADVQNGDGKAINWAARHNKPAIAKKSIQAGVKTLRQWHREPLLFALNKGHEAIMRLLLDEGVDPDEILFKGSRMETTALYIAARDGRDGIVKLLIDKGASVNLKNAPREPLVIAAANNKKTIVRLLLEKGADPNARRDDGVTALSIAVMRKHTEIASMLLDKGADTELGKHGTTPLQIAVMKNHCRITQLLLDRGADVGSQDNYGRSVLDLGVRHGSQRSLGLLLKHGANLNTQSSYPLHAAISEIGATYDKKASMVRLLLDHGADINRKDSEGRTPLLYAMIFGYDEIVDLLLLYDIDPDAGNHYGLTPLKLAQNKKREDWAQKLRRKLVIRDLKST